jgi:hypothetical protein
MVSMMVGLPGETHADVRRTRAWVESLREEQLSVFPMLYAPVDGTAPPRARDLTTGHWRLIKSCYQYNFRHVPRMYWDNQAAAGVSRAKRCLMQLLGRGQVAQWKLLLAWRTLMSRQHG